MNNIVYSKYSIYYIVYSNYSIYRIVYSNYSILVNVYADYGIPTVQLLYILANNQSHFCILNYLLILVTRMSIIKDCIKLLNNFVFLNVIHNPICPLNKHMEAS